MERYTLNDLENLTGIKTDTIRIWERRYGLLKPNLTPTGRRWYTGQDLVRLLNISQLYRNGVKISAIARLSDTEISSRVGLLHAKGKSGDDNIGDLVVAMNNLDEDAVNELLMKSIIKRGLEDTYASLVFPLLRKVGILWHTGSISIGTEHFISTIFRNRLIIATDLIKTSTKPGGKRFLLFLPEEEFHELSLLFINYIVRKSGNEVVYLGQATPLKAVADAVQKWSPDYIVTGTLSGIGISEPDLYLSELKKISNDAQVIIYGSIARSLDDESLEGIIPLKNISDLTALLKQIGLEVG